jgi:hypothetical protein
VIITTRRSTIGATVNDSPLSARARLSAGSTIRTQNSSPRRSTRYSPSTPTSARPSNSPSTVVGPARCVIVR